MNKATTNTGYAVCNAANSKNFKMRQQNNFLKIVLLIIFISNLLFNLNMKGQCITNINYIQVGTGGTYLASTTPPFNSGTVSSTNIQFWGTLIVDQSLVLNGCIIEMAPASEIQVLDIAFFEINQTTFTSCSNGNGDMWNGIVGHGNVQSADPYSRIHILNNSLIEDALNGVYTGPMENVELIIDNSTFNRNYIHVNLDYYFGSIATGAQYLAPVSITASRFYCKSNGINGNFLHNPFLGNRTERAIAVGHYGHNSPLTLLNFGDLNAGNEVDFCNDGLFIHYSFFDSEHNIIKNCINGIVNDFDGYYFSENDQILNTSSNGYDLSDNITKIKIRNNVIEETGTGIEVSDNCGEDCLLEGNQIINYRDAGIEATNNYYVNCNIRFKSNILPTIYHDVTGIYYGEMFFAKLNDTHVEITNNTISGADRGIEVVNTFDVKVFNNVIQFAMPQAPIPNCFGISIENSHDSEIKGNSVTGNFVYACQQETYGIRIDNSNDIPILCNDVDLVGRGFWFGGTTNSIFFGGNYLGNCLDQFYLFNNINGLGEQGSGLADFQNSWLDDPSPLCSSHKYANGIGSNILPGKTNYYIFNYTPAFNLSPTNNFMLGGQITFFDLPQTTVNQICIADENIQLQQLIKTATDTNILQSGLETYKWNELNSYYSVIHSNPAYLDSSALLQPLFDSLSSSNISLFSAVSDTLFDNDSTLNIYVADSLNNEVSPVYTAEYFLKQINSIAIQVKEGGLTSLTNSQRQTVFYVANLCPYEAGIGVYTARVIAMRLDTALKYFPDNLCNDFAERIFQSGSHKSNPLTISAFYNQATGEIEIISNVSIETPFCITLLNSLGQAIQIKYYNGYSEKIILPIRNIPNGIYLINLATTKQENSSTKLLIQY